MEKIILEVPADIAQAVRLPPGELEREFRKELALGLYLRGAISLGKGRALAEMTRWEFEELLAARRIPRHYTAADVDEDIRYAAGDQ